MLIFLSLLFLNYNEYIHICSMEVVECHTEPTKEDIVEYIVEQARIHGVDENTAVRIAKCESSLNPKAKNKNSSASGLFQFLIGTWQWIGAEEQGLDRMNYKHSTDMFMKYHKKYPTWWVECHKFDK